MAAFLTLISAPGVYEPEEEEEEGGDDPVQVVTVEELKSHLRISNDQEDDYLSGLIAAATSLIDGGAGWLGRALLTQTWKLTLDAFPCDAITIPLPPLQTVESITFIDENGDEQTVDEEDYAILMSEPAKVRPAPGSSWPVTSSRSGAVEVVFTAGYGDEGSATPAPIRQWIMMVCGSLYANRETVVAGVSIQEVPPHIMNMIDGYRIRGALYAGGQA